MRRLDYSPFADPITRLAVNLAGVFSHTDRATALRYANALLWHAPEVVRARNLRPVDAAMAGKPVHFYVDDTEIALDGSEFSSAREMYCRRVYFSHPRVKLAANSTVLDLGANIGLFTLVAALRRCRVVAVEAQHGFVNIIERRLARFPQVGRVDIECALLGASSGIFANSQALQEASHYDINQAAPALTMEALLERHQLDRIDFLKCDIEGSEFGLFDGGTAWISRVQQVAMEVHPSFGDPTQIARTLSAAGMRTELFDHLLRRNEHPDAEGGYLFAWRDK